jgi:hypothetical protein
MGIVSGIALRETAGCGNNGEATSINYISGKKNSWIVVGKQRKG